MKSHPQFQIEIGNAKRWADGLTWRAVFVFLIGPGVQVLAWWILAGLDRAAVPNNLVMAYCHLLDKIHLWISNFAIKSTR